MAQTKEQLKLQSPFEDADESAKAKSKFLGIFNKRYLRTFSGAVHGLASTLALVLGNCLFLFHTIFGYDKEVSSSTTSFLSYLNVAFFICNMISAGVTYFFFWNKVQSWQLSTTSMEKRGLTPTILKKLNQGRGVVTVFLCSLFPTVCIMFPRSFLENNVFSATVAAIALYTSIEVYFLIREYQSRVYLFYGLTHIGLALSIVLNGTIGQLIDNHPKLLSMMENEAYFVLNCVQFGFMLYYLYSRRIISKSFVQKGCRVYHPNVAMIFLARLQYGAWWSNLPVPMLLQPTLLSLFAIFFFCQMTLKKLQGQVNSSSSSSNSNDVVGESTGTTAPSQQQPSDAPSPLFFAFRENKINASSTVRRLSSSSSSKLTRTTATKPRRNSSSSSSTALRLQTATK